jgi:hypothetical protein
MRVDDGEPDMGGLFVACGPDAHARSIFDAYSSPHSNCGHTHPDFGRTHLAAGRIYAIAG